MAISKAAQKAIDAAKAAQSPNAPIGHKPTESELKALAEKVYREKTIKLYGPVVEAMGLLSYDDLEGQPKSYGVLAGAYTIASGIVSGLIAINGDDLVMGKGKGTRLWKSLVCCASDSAWSHWTKKGRIVDGKGMTLQGLEVCRARIGKTVVSGIKLDTSLSMVQDFVTIMTNPKQPTESRIKDAMNNVKFRVVSAHANEPVNK